MKRILFLSCVLVAFLFVLLMGSPKRKESAPVGVETPTQEIIRTVYEEGHMRGYESLFAQMACMQQDASLIQAEKEEGAKAMYTSNNHYDEEEFMRGYVDGYHRAAEIYSKKAMLSGSDCPY